MRPGVGLRLNSWKEIAAYFHRGVTPVQRGEREEGLPVHRLTHESGSSVYAYESELARWHAMRSRRAREPLVEETVANPAPMVMPHPWRPIAAAAAACMAALSIWYLRPGVTQASAMHVVPVAATEVTETEADVSRDGKFVVYVAAGELGGEAWRLIVKTLRSNETRTIWTGQGRPQFPQWSRDGRRILFSQITGRKVEIAILDTAGGSVQALLTMEDPAYERQRAIRWAVWDAADRAIVVSRIKAAGGPYALYRYSLDGKELAQLTRPAPGTLGDQQAAVSPNGREIAFVRNRTPTESEIYVTDSAGGEPRQVTEVGNYYGLTWTPEGRDLIYGARMHSPATNLWRIPSGGGDPRRLTVSDADSSWPSIAAGPGGASVIAYQKSQMTVNVMHWEKPELGGEGKRACPSSYFEASAQYSPDGTKLAYESRRGGTSEIWTCDLRTGRAVQLTNNGGPTTDSPRWSPDGQTISFTTFAGGSRNIYLADVAGKAAVRPLIAEPADEGRASWSRDGRWIYFRSDRGGQADLWKMPAAGGAPIRVTTTGAFEGFESADGKRLYFTRARRSPGLWSVNAGGGGERFETADVREGWWAVTTKGILFLPAGRFRELWRYDPATGRREMVRRLAPEAPSVWTGFTARWDGQAVAWSQTTIDIQDVVMLQGVLF